MTSGKAKRVKSTKKKAPAKKAAAKKPRQMVSKVGKRMTSASKSVSRLKKAARVKGVARSKATPKKKVAARRKTVSKPKAAPRPKIVSKQKVSPKIKPASKAKVTAAQIKRVAPTQKKKPMPKLKEENFRSAFMKSLKLKKEELQETLDRLMKSRKEYEGQLTAGDFIDEVDDAQREISAYSQFSLIERKNKELQKIEYLLNRVAEEQDFGICEECGTRIPKERLLLVPEATLCVACQRELEKMDSRMSIASRSSGFSPTRREVTWETTEPPEEDDNLLVEYTIGTLPNVDMEETDTEAPPEDKEDKED